MGEVQDWFRAADLAARWRVHRVTIWRWVRTGELPKPTKLSTRVAAWPRKAVLAFERRTAREHLADVGLDDAARDRHARWYMCSREWIEP